MIDEAAIERLLPSLFAMKGTEATATAARAAAERLLDLLDNIVRAEQKTAPDVKDWSCTGREAS